MNDINSDPTLSLDNIPIHIKHSSRAKRIIIRINMEYRGVELVIPPHSNKQEAQKFLQSHKNWVLKQIHKLGKPIPLIEQSVITLLDQPHQLSIQKAIDPSAQSIIHNQQIDIYASNQTRANSRLHILLKQYAHEQFSIIAFHYAKRIKQTIHDIRINDTKSRWGSCSNNKEISLSWRLLFSPKQVAHYVIAHEVAHLQHMNHSQSFWSLVQALIPNYRQYQTWLKQNGYLLHQYR